jgi:hypothetical protein
MPDTITDATGAIDEIVEPDNIYTPSLEYFLQRKGEECEAWSNLHLMAHKKFRKRETMFNLPIITITAFIGFVSGLNLSYEYIHLILGGMSLYASLLKSYFSYLKISQKSENHRIAYIQYGQIANEIRVELALEPSDAAGDWQGAWPAAVVWQGINLVPRPGGRLWLGATLEPGLNADAAALQAMADLNGHAPHG